jgi:hypothetical protein
MRLVQEEYLVQKCSLKPMELIDILSCALVVY